MTSPFAARQTRVAFWAIAFAASVLLSVTSPSPARAAAAAADTSAVEVVFLDADRHADPGDSPAEIKENQTRLRRHLQQLGLRWLPQGARLRIEVTNIDLAGRVLPALRSPERIRVLAGGADWPRIDFRYVLTRPDGGAERGTETLSDPAYQTHRIEHSGPDRLPYEQRLLSQWFRERFEKPGASAPAH